MLLVDPFQPLIPTTQKSRASHSQTPASLFPSESGEPQHKTDQQHRGAVGKCSDHWVTGSLKNKQALRLAAAEKALQATSKANMAMSGGTGGGGGGSSAGAPGHTCQRAIHMNVQVIQDIEMHVC